MLQCYCRRSMCIHSTSCQNNAAYKNVVARKISKFIVRCRLVEEGFSEVDANKAMPYAAQALGIATACVGGVGVAGGALLHVSGVDLKESVRVSSARDAWAQVQAQSIGSALGSRLRALGEKVATSLPPIDSSRGAKPPDFKTD